MREYIDDLPRCVTAVEEKARWNRTPKTVLGPRGQPRKRKTDCEVMMTEIVDLLGLRSSWYSLAVESEQLQEVCGASLENALLRLL